VSRPVCQGEGLKPRPSPTSGNGQGSIGDALYYVAARKSFLKVRSRGVLDTISPAERILAEDGLDTREATALVHTLMTSYVETIRIPTSISRSRCIRLREIVALVPEMQRKTRRSRRGHDDISEAFPGRLPRRYQRPPGHICLFGCQLTHDGSIPKANFRRMRSSMRSHISSRVCGLARINLRRTRII